MLEGLTPEKEPQPCRAITLALELEAKDAQILLDAYQDQRWTANALSKALRARGVNISKDTIRNHKEKACKCLKI